MTEVVVGVSFIVAIGALALVDGIAASDHHRPPEWDLWVLPLVSVVGLVVLIRLLQLRRRRAQRSGSDPGAPA